MRIRSFGIIDETNDAAIGLVGRGDGLNPMATRREPLQRGDGRAFVNAQSQCQRQRGQRVRKQMRIYRAIRLGQMREVGDVGHFHGLVRFAAGNAAHIDDPTVDDADLARLRLMQRKSDTAATLCRFGPFGQFGDTNVVGIVDQCLAGTMEHLRLIGRVVVNASMPVKMIIGDVGDGRTIQCERIREMQLEGAQFNA